MSRIVAAILPLLLLAKTWGIPNVYRADADQLYAALAGKQVVLEATGASVTERPATDAEVRKAEAAQSARAIRAPRADLTYTGLPALTEQTAKWVNRTGTKAANLGTVAAITRRYQAGFTCRRGSACRSLITTASSPPTASTRTSTR